MLDTQYRMHPAISAFPSQAFYNGDLRDGTVKTNGRIGSGFEPPITAFLEHDEFGKRQNITFLDHDHPESPQTRSIANYGDAEKVCDIVTDLLLNNPVNSSHISIYVSLMIYRNYVVTISVSSLHTPLRSDLSTSIFDQTPDQSAQIGMMQSWVRLERVI